MNQEHTKASRAWDKGLPKNDAQTLLNPVRARRTTGKSFGCHI